MVKKVDGWTGAIVRGCLKGMGQIGDDNLDMWLEANVRLTPLPTASLHSFIQTLTTNRRPPPRIRAVDRSIGMCIGRQSRLTTRVSIYTQYARQLRLGA